MATPSFVGATLPAQAKLLVFLIGHGQLFCHPLVEPKIALPLKELLQDTINRCHFLYAVRTSNPVTSVMRNAGFMSAVTVQKQLPVCAMLPQ